jgi:RNA polymerase sigma factor (sigma-70 family)
MAESDSLIEHADWLRSVFERYERPVVAYALRLLRSDIEAARDCAQDTFLQLCALPADSRPERIDAWLFCTCRYRVIDRIRKEKNMAYSNTSLEPLSSPHGGSEAADTVIEREDQQRLTNELNNLSDRQRQVVLLRLTEGLSYKRIAEQTGLNVNAVGVYLHEAIMRLRIALQDAPASASSARS